MGGPEAGNEADMDSAEVEEAVAKDCERQLPSTPPDVLSDLRPHSIGEERGRTFSEQFRSLQAKFPYKPIPPPAGYSMEELDMVVTTPSSLRGKGRTGRSETAAAEELRRL